MYGIGPSHSKMVTVAAIGLVTVVLPESSDVTVATLCAVR